jgi:hypothetical protein
MSLGVEWVLGEVATIAQFVRVWQNSLVCSIDCLCRLGESSKPDATRSNDAHVSGLVEDSSPQPIKIGKYHCQKNMSHP